MAKKKPCCGRGVYPPGIAYELRTAVGHNDIYKFLCKKTFTCKRGWGHVLVFCKCEKGRLLKKAYELREFLME